MKNIIYKSELVNSLGKLSIIIFLAFAFGIKSNAQLVVPFAKNPDQIFSVKGDYTMFGNTLLIKSPYTVDGQNGNNDMMYVDIDSDVNTWNSSSADFDFAVEPGVNPNCTQILYAGLYWTGRANNGGSNAGTTVDATRFYNGNLETRTFTKNQIKLKYGTDSYQNVTGTFIANPPSDYYQIYSCYADVTGYVQSKGAGTYTVADMALVQGNADGVGYFGCWSMVVVYQNGKMKTKNIAIFQGHAFNSTNNIVDIPIVGFQAVQSGDVNVKLGFMAGEGDRDLIGDYAKIQELNTPNFKSLSHSGNTTNNFFNSSINTGGNARNPNYTNNYGIDVAMFYLDNGNDSDPNTPAVNSVIGNGQTSTIIRVGTTSDIYTMSVLVFGVDAYQPETDEVIKLTEINGNPATAPYSCTPGQELTYCVDIKNVGTEPVKDYTLSVPVPTNADFVTNSVSVTLNPLVGTPNTPKPVYNPTTRSLEWDFGNLPLPADPNTVLASFCFKLKATTNCLLLSNSCGQDIPVTGYSNGTGVITDAHIVNQKFILGYVNSGECSNEKINGNLVAHINGAAYVVANCDANLQDGVLDLEIVQNAAGYPVANVTPYFPPGTKFYSAYPVVSGTIEYNASNPFPAVDGTVKTYWAVPPGPNACPIKIILTCVNNCSFSVNCGNQPSGNYDCSRPIPAAVTTLSKFNSTFGASQGQNPCYTIKMKVIEDPNFNACTSLEYVRTYRIYQDNNNNNQYDTGEQFVDCVKSYVWLRDQTKPHYSCDPDTPVLIGCRTSGPTAQDAITAAGYSDNCTATDQLTIVATPLDITTNVACYKIQNWKVEATDLCGNYASVIVQVKWTTDTQAPAFDDPNDKTIDLGCNPTAPNATKAKSDAGNATDNCGTPTITATGGSTSGSCSKTQVWTVKATDACGNVTSKKITYTWKSDTQKPTFSNCKSGQIIATNGALPPTAADAIAMVGTISDNCTAYANLIITATGGNIESSGGDGCKYTQMWTVTATDECGNKMTCTFGLTWGSDTESPVFSNCPSAAIQLGCNPTKPTANDAIANAGTVTDNSGGFIQLTATGGAITSSPNNSCTKNQIFTVTATDACGNSAECKVTFTWKEDTQGPTFGTNPPPEGVQLGCLGQGGATEAQAIAAVGPITDNCSSGNLTISAVGGAISGECNKTQDWTVTAKDDCNNISTKVVTLKWTFDDQNPVFENCPTGDIDLGCNPVNLPTAAWIQDLVNILPDNCGQVTKEIVAGPITGTCNKKQTFTVTAKDNCNNVATCSVTYKWKDDKEPPTFSNCPTIPILLPTGLNPTEEMAITAVGVIHDNCTQNVVVTTTYTEENGFCGVIKKFKVKATDACGNADSCLVQYVTEGNTEPPVFTFPPTGPIDLGCNPPTSNLPTTQKAIQDAGEVTDDVRVESVTATAGPILGTCLKTQKFTVQAADDCGNVTAIYVTYFWRVDTEKPVFPACPSAPFEVPNINDVTDALAKEKAGTPTDNCGVMNITTSKIQVAGPCGPTVVYTVTATDTCGNSSSCVISFKTHDGKNPPVFESCPKNPFDLGCNPKTLPTTGSVAEGAGTVTDDGEVVAINVTPGEITGEDCNKSQIFTVTAVDDCGNESHCYMTYIWTIDTIKPVFTNIPRSEIDLGCNPTVMPSQQMITDSIHIADNCEIGSFTAIGGPITGDDCKKMQEWTLTAVDKCGNTADTTLTFTWRIDVVPPVITCPVYNGSAQCSDDTPLAYNNLAEFLAAGGTASDNCTSPTNLQFRKLSDQMSGDCSTGVHVTRIYEVEDECGNKAQCTQTINIIDNTPPTIVSGPPTKVVACAFQVPAHDNSQVVATDNCSNVTISFVGDQISNKTCANKYKITRTYRATDECDNHSDFVQLIYVNDTIPPTIVTPPAITGLQCNNEVPAPYSTIAEFVNAGGTISDNCTGGDDNILTLTYVSESINSGNCANSYVITRIYKATDACGNHSTATQTITVSDNTKPLITPPGPITVACASDVPAPNVNSVTVSDNCSTNSAITVTFVSDDISNQTCANKYTVTRTYKATDECGNYATATQIITVNDNVPPVVVNPPPVNGGECATQAPAPFTTISQIIEAGGQVSDNCSPNSKLTLTLLSNNTTGDCGTGISVNRVYEVKDECDNKTTFTQVLYIIDNTPPTIVSGPQTPLNISCASDVPMPNINLIVATDNCSNVTVTFVGDVVSNQTCLNKFKITRTYRVVDACGNHTDYIQIINVNDVTPPVMTPPNPITGIQCGDQVPAPYATIVEYTNAGGTISDNCNAQGNIITLSFVGDEIVPGNCANSFTIIRTYKATDICGNYSTMQQTIVVTDNTKPLITPPGAITVTCASDVPAPDTNLVIASDNCSSASAVSVTFVSDVITNQICANKYTITRTYKATDECGNFATATQTITVFDNIPPVIIPPADVTGIQCASDIPAPFVNAEQFVAAGGQVSDNCEGGVVVVMIQESIVAGDCVNQYDLIRTYKATDVCGNTSIATHQIHVFDNTPPQITIPADLTVSCAEDVPPVNTNSVIATDNCSGVVTVTADDDVVTGQTCINRFVISRTYTATDICGNSTSATQTITVFDEIPPVMTVPADLNVICATDVPAPNISLVTASDNCVGDVTITHVSDVIINQECLNKFTVQRTYKATDVCGNFTTKVQLINVNDNVPPSITAPDDLLVSCSEDVPAPNINQVVASDNCQGEVTITHVGDVITEQTCANQYTIERTYQATDACGNTSTDVQYIEVKDLIPPTIACPPTLTFQCASEVPTPNTSGVSATDNCEGDVLITWSGDEIVDQTCTNRFTVHRTYRATDACGNYSECVQDIIVNDDTPPVISINNPYFAGVPNGGSISIQCRAMEPGWELPTLLQSEVSATDNCGAVTFVLDKTVSDGECKTDGYFKKVHIKITAVDLCNNQATHEFDILIVDEIPPVFTVVPPDATMSCVNSDLTYEVKAEDECECADITYADQIVNGACAGTYTIYRTYTAKDCCGNMSTYTQKINVVDDTPPQIIPEDRKLASIKNGDVVTTYCGSDEFPTWLNKPVNQLISAVDLCSSNPKLGLKITEENQDACWLYGYSKQYTVLFTATDACGNQGELKFYIQVKDTTAPEVMYLNEFICEDDNAFPVVFDNCSSLTYESTDIPVTGECDGSNNFIRVWTISDACQNTIYTTQYVVKNDHKAPVIHMINPMFSGHLSGDIVSMDCEDWNNVSKEEAMTWVEAEDKCDYITLDFNSRLINGNCLTDGFKSMYEYTWTAADYCGNQSTYVLFVQLTDNTPPVFNTSLTTVNVDCENSIPVVKASDNCSDVTLTVNRTKYELGCPNNFTLDEVYTATDACGNVATFSRVVNVIDTVGPIIYVPDAICETDLGSQNVVAFDYCTGKPSHVSVSTDHNIVNCNGSSYYTITYSSTDYCGNTTNKVQKVIVEDNTPPVLSFSYDMQNQYNIVDNTIYAGCDNFEDIVKLIDKSDAVVVSDECGNIITPVFTESEGNTQCEGGYITKEHFFRWTATDACGNAADLDLKVILQALETYDFSFIPADTTVYCNEVVALPTVLPELKCTEASLTSSIHHGQSSPDGSYIEERTFTYTNLCGDQTSYTQIVNHSFNSDLSCNITIPTDVYCNSSNNLFTVVVTGGQAPYTYDWEILNGWCHILAGQHTPTVQISISFKTLYLKVKVTDARGCSTECYVEVDCTLDNPGINVVDPHVAESGTAIGQMNIINDYTLRPNPTSSQVYVDFESKLAEKVIINVTDNFGKLVLSKKVTTVKGFNSEMLDTNNLPVGLYQVSLISSDKLKTLQLIKVK